MKAEVVRATGRFRFVLIVNIREFIFTAKCQQKPALRRKSRNFKPGIFAPDFQRREIGVRR